MIIESIKMIVSFEKGVDFTDNDLIKKFYDYYLKDEYKENFMRKHGFTNISRQFPMLAANRTYYCKIEFENYKTTDLHLVK